MLLIATCGGVSLAHGSNDGQKGIGLMMLIVVGLVPAGFALDLEASPRAVRAAADAAAAIEREIAPLAVDCLETIEGDPLPGMTAPACVIAHHAHVATTTLGEHRLVREIPPDERWRVREGAIRIEAALRDLDAEDDLRTSLAAHRTVLAGLTDFAPSWVLLLTALALGVGTTVGWKRIVVTVGEKIGKAHLTYAQGAAAELVAASTIGVASLMGLPVSTTHVLSSGIAGTMLVDGAGVQSKTIRSIALAWLFTLPASMALSALLYALFASLVG